MRGSARPTFTTRSTGPLSGSTCTSSSGTALRPMSPPSWARARSAPTCSASATCNRPPRSSSGCARWCARRWRKELSGSPPRSSTARTSTLAPPSSWGAPAEIYHLKAAGRGNWGKLDALIHEVEAARAAGVRITADMYVYTAGATGLDAAMPPWVQDGGLEAWIGRLQDPAVRARVLAEMRDPAPPWENLYGAAGAAGTLLLGFKNPQLKPLTGKTLAEVAKMRGVSAEDAAVDLVIQDGSRVAVAYFLMSEENVRRELALPWVSFDSDADAPAPEGVFLKSSRHPRTYGNFARLLAKYVREERLLGLEQAIHKLTALPAATLSLAGRGMLKTGDFADVVVFDPATIQDHATYEHPHQLATGVDEVWVNGVRALRAGEATGAASGRAVLGRAWTGAAGGGCRASAREWTWSP